MTYCCHTYYDIVFIKNGGNLMINPYEKCPVYENENYMLRGAERIREKHL